MTDENTGAVAVTRVEGVRRPVPKQSLFPFGSMLLVMIAMLVGISGGLFSYNDLGVPVQTERGTVIDKRVTDRGQWMLDLAFGGHRKVAFVDAASYDAGAVGAEVSVTFWEPRMDGLEVLQVGPPGRGTVTAP